MEVGNLRSAEEGFRALLSTEEGALSAEVHYALAAVAWERRDARAAWSWLTQGKEAAQGSAAWNPGASGRWDARIDERLRYIQAQFTVRMLRPPERGSSIPPLADPRPRDPVLSEFADAIPQLIAASEESAPGKAIWLLLPNHSYWVGERIEWHGGGELEATRAAEWQLEAASGQALVDHEARLDALANGGSLGRDLIRKLMIARKAPGPMVQSELARQKAEALAADYARRKPELEAARSRQQALLAAGKANEAAAVSFGPTSQATTQAILTWDEVDGDALAAVNKQIETVWTEPGWHLRYAVMCPSKETSHGLSLPDLGVVLKFDKGGEVSLKGTGKARESWKDIWYLGGKPNRIDVWFDGRQMMVAANGRALGPVEVVGEAPTGRTAWRLSLDDDTALIFDLRVESFTGF